MRFAVLFGSVVLSCVVLAETIPSGVFIDGKDVAVESGSGSWTYDSETKLVTVISGDHTISGTNQQGRVRFELKAYGKTITLDNLVLEGLSKGSAITVSSNTKILLKGSSRLKGAADSAGVSVSDVRLEIDKAGYDAVLQSYGGSSAAGIGGGAFGGVGTIRVAGGRVEAYGGTGGAGIGSGEEPRYSENNLNYIDTEGTVEIAGGEVIAVGGYNGAGIGTGARNRGYGIAVSISGGRVWATGRGCACGIGSGRYSSLFPARLAISGGTVWATHGDAGGYDIGTFSDPSRSQLASYPYKYGHYLTISGGSVVGANDSYYSYIVDASSGKRLVYPVALSYDRSDNVGVYGLPPGYGTNDIHPIDGRVVVWLPIADTNYDAVLRGDAHNDYHYAIDVRSSYVPQLVTNTTYVTGFTLNGTDLGSFEDASKTWHYDYALTSLTVNASIEYVFSGVDTNFDCLVSLEDEAAAKGAVFVASNAMFKAMNIPLLVRNATVCFDEIEGPLFVSGGNVLNGKAVAAWTSTNRTERTWKVLFENAQWENSPLVITNLPASYDVRGIRAVDGRLGLWLPSGTYVPSVNGDNYLVVVTNADAQATAFTGVTVNGLDLVYGAGEGWSYSASDRWLELDCGATNRFEIAGDFGSRLHLAAKKSAAGAGLRTVVVDGGVFVAAEDGTNVLDIVSNGRYSGGYASQVGLREDGSLQLDVGLYAFKPPAGSFDPSAMNCLPVDADAWLLLARSAASGISVGGLDLTDAKLAESNVIYNADSGTVRFWNAWTYALSGTNQVGTIRIVETVPGTVLSFDGLIVTNAADALVMTGGYAEDLKGSVTNANGTVLFDAGLYACDPGTNVVAGFASYRVETARWIVTTNQPCAKVLRMSDGVEVYVFDILDALEMDIPMKVELLRDAEAADVLPVETSMTIDGCGHRLRVSTENGAPLFDLGSNAVVRVDGVVFDGALSNSCALANVDLGARLELFDSRVTGFRTIDDSIVATFGGELFLSNVVFTANVASNAAIVLAESDAPTNGHVCVFSDVTITGNVCEVAFASENATGFAGAHWVEGGRIADNGDAYDLQLLDGVTCVSAAFAKGKVMVEDGAALAFTDAYPSKLVLLPRDAESFADSPIVTNACRLASPISAGDVTVLLADARAVGSDGTFYLASYSAFRYAVETPNGFVLYQNFDAARLAGNGTVYLVRHVNDDTFESSDTVSDPLSIGAGTNVTLRSVTCHVSDYTNVVWSTSGVDPTRLTGPVTAAGRLTLGDVVLDTTVSLDSGEVVLTDGFDCELSWVRMVVADETAYGTNRAAVVSANRTLEELSECFVLSKGAQTYVEIAGGLGIVATASYTAWADGVYYKTLGEAFSSVTNGGRVAVVGYTNRTDGTFCRKIRAGDGVSLRDGYSVTLGTVFRTLADGEDPVDSDSETLTLDAGGARFVLGEGSMLALTNLTVSGTLELSGTGGFALGGYHGAPVHLKVARRGLVATGVEPGGLVLEGPGRLVYSDGNAYWNSGTFTARFVQMGNGTGRIEVDDAGFLTNLVVSVQTNVCTWSYRDPTGVSGVETNLSFGVVFLKANRQLLLPDKALYGTSDGYPSYKNLLNAFRPLVSVDVPSDLPIVSQLPTAFGSILTLRLECRNYDSTFVLGEVTKGVYDEKKVSKTIKREMEKQKKKTEKEEEESEEHLRKIRRDMEDLLKELLKWAYEFSSGAGKKAGDMLRDLVDEMGKLKSCCYVGDDSSNSSRYYIIARRGLNKAVALKEPINFISDATITDFKVKYGVSLIVRAGKAHNINTSKFLPPSVESFMPPGVAPIKFLISSAKKFGLTALGRIFESAANSSGLKWKLRPGNEKKPMFTVCSGGNLGVSDLGESSMRVSNGSVTALRAPMFRVCHNASLSLAACSVTSKYGMPLAGIVAVEGPNSSLALTGSTQIGSSEHPNGIALSNGLIVNLQPGFQGTIGITGNTGLGAAFAMAPEVSSNVKIYNADHPDYLATYRSDSHLYYWRVSGTVVGCVVSGAVSNDFATFSQMLPLLQAAHGGEVRLIRTLNVGANDAIGSQSFDWTLDGRGNTIAFAAEPQLPFVGVPSGRTVTIRNLTAGYTSAAHRPFVSVAPTGVLRLCGAVSIPHVLISDAALRAEGVTGSVGVDGVNSSGQAFGVAESGSSTDAAWQSFVSCRNSSLGRQVRDGKCYWVYNGPMPLDFDPKKPFKIACVRAGSGTKVTLSGTLLSSVPGLWYWIEKTPSLDQAFTPILSTVVTPAAVMSLDFPYEESSNMPSCFYRVSVSDAPPGN